MASIKLKGDTSGEVTIQAPAVAGTTTLNLPATSSTLATQNALGVRNLITNGDMRINQRGFASDVDNAFTVDRFLYQSSQGDKFTITQDTDVPSGEGFVNSLKFVTASAVTVGASDYFMLSQPIEGTNAAVLNLGTSGAKTFTLSFWTRSSLTGTFGGAIGNSVANRYYPFTYTISSADTWERKTVTIDGHTTGTWLTTNGIGLMVRFGLGVGSSKSGTAGSWQVAEYFSATGATSVVGTGSATWYITGVQLEVGDTATPFEHRPYDMELQRCFRYFEKLDAKVNGTSGSTVISRCHWLFKARKRATPTIVEVGVAKTGVENTSPDSYGINRIAGNESIIGSGSTADSEL